MKKLLLYFSCCLLLNCTSKETKQTTTANDKVETSANQTADKPDESKKEKGAQKLGMEALIEAYTKKTGAKITLTKKDFANGYAEFEFEGAIKLVCQFAYYLTQDGKEMLAVTIPQCMGGCSTMLLFYTMLNGELSENQDMMEGFADMNAFKVSLRDIFMTEADKKRMQSGDMTPIDQILKLPQQGTSIACIKNFMGKEQKVAELQFNAKTGKFKLVKL